VDLQETGVLKLVYCSSSLQAEVAFIAIDRTRALGRKTAKEDFVSVREWRMD
jgi:hypothetical protein